MNIFKLFSYTFALSISPNFILLLLLYNFKVWQNQTTDLSPSATSIDLLVVLQSVLIPKSLSVEVELLYAQLFERYSVRN